ncbi:MAG: hypothetical protein RLZZ362_588 [Actinomycetota bacterium]
MDEVKPGASRGVGTGGASDDRPLDVRVADGALRHVIANLTGLQLLLLPLALAVALVTRNHVDSDRLTVWVLIALVTNVAVVAACARFRKSGPLDRLDVALAAIAHAGIGVLAGASPWVAGDGARDMLLLFTLISAVSGAVSAAACAGRRDIYVAFIAPIMVLTPWTLWASGDGLMRSVAVLFLVWGMSQAVLHQKFSRSVRVLLRLQFDSETVAARISRDREELSRAYELLSVSNDRLAHLASHDPLTGLLNRRGTIEQIDLALGCASHDAPVAVLYLDLDRFKAVNDLLGHRGGDAFISTLTDRMVRTIDDDCFAGRIGGDEFVVVLPRHGTDEAERVAQQLVSGMAQPVHAEGRSVPSSVSVGVAVAPQHGISTSDLLRNANTALFRAKHAGRNRVENFEPRMQVQLQTVLSQEQALRRALDNGEILPYFQPEIDAVTGAVTGAELLARWLRPDGTTMLASEFIEQARKAGLLERLTERVLAQARPDIRRLIALGLPAGFRFRINLGPASTDRLRNDPIDELLRGIHPSMVTVDVREASVVSDLDSAVTALSSFRAAGGKVCLDDFVHGVSSLTILRRLPIDEVRIDREAIDSIAAHPHDCAIVRSIISVVLEIGLGVSAEGVETGAQSDALIALGCVRQQGHLYAPALPAQLFESFLLQQQAASYAAAQQGPERNWATQELD